MSGDQLNLDDILRRAADGAADEDLHFTRLEVLTADVPELVAEVRRLRAWAAQAAYNAELAGSDGDV